MLRGNAQRSRWLEQERVSGGDGDDPTDRSGGKAGGGAWTQFPRELGLAGSLGAGMHRDQNGFGKSDSGHSLDDDLQGLGSAWRQNQSLLPTSLGT